jgi:hypothetical protein
MPTQMVIWEYFYYKRRMHRTRKIGKKVRTLNAGESFNDLFLCSNSLFLRALDNDSFTSPISGADRTKII